MWHCRMSLKMSRKVVRFRTPTIKSMRELSCNETKNLHVSLQWRSNCNERKTSTPYVYAKDKDMLLRPQRQCRQMWRRIMIMLAFDFSKLEDLGFAMTSLRMMSL
jgi:hypothetical protein